MSNLFCLLFPLFPSNFLSKIVRKFPKSGNVFARFKLRDGLHFQIINKHEIPNLFKEISVNRVRRFPFSWPPQSEFITEINSYGKCKK